MRIFAHANYDFIRWRWHALILSIVLIWAGVGSMYLKGGVRYGIEFTGGTAVVLKFAQPVGEDVVRKAVDPISKETVVQQYGPPANHEIVVRLPIMKGQEEGAALEQDARKIEQAVRAANVGQFEVRSKDSIG